MGKTSTTSLFTGILTYKIFICVTALPKMLFKFLKCQHQAKAFSSKKKVVVLGHLYKHHVALDEAPYYCTLCMFRSLGRRELEKHVGHYAPHDQRVEAFKQSKIPYDLKESLHTSSHPRELKEGVDFEIVPDTLPVAPEVSYSPRKAAQPVHAHARRSTPACAAVPAISPSVVSIPLSGGDVTPPHETSAKEVIPLVTASPAPAQKRPHDKSTKEVIPLNTSSSSPAEKRPHASIKEVIPLDETPLKKVCKETTEGEKKKVNKVRKFVLKKRVRPLSISTVSDSTVSSPARSSHSINNSSPAKKAASSSASSTTSTQASSSNSSSSCSSRSSCHALTAVSVQQLINNAFDKERAATVANQASIA